MIKKGEWYIYNNMLVIVTELSLYSARIAFPEGGIFKDGTFKSCRNVYASELTEAPISANYPPASLPTLVDLALDTGDTEWLRDLSKFQTKGVN